MTVERTSQSWPSNVIVHDDGANLPTRISNFGCIGIWPRVTARQINSI